MKNVSITAGRILLGLYFLVPGILKFVAWDLHIGLMEKHGMPFASALLPIAALTQIISSSLILASRYVAESAFVLAAMIIAINFSLHDFWNYSGIEGAHETQNFVKNLAIMGGMLILGGINLKNKT